MSNAGLSILSETDDKFKIKEIGSIGGANQRLDVNTFEMTKDSKLAQNFIFDQLSRLLNLSMISQDIDALVHYDGTKQGFISLIKDYLLL